MPLRPNKLFMISLVAVLSVAMQAGAATLYSAVGEKHKDRYIITLAPGNEFPRLASDVARTHNLEVGRVFAEWNSFVALVPAAALNGILRDPRVESVEEDALAVLSSAGNQPVDNSASYPSNWGLDRTDEWTPLQDGTYYDGTYEWCTSGTGVVVYVVDSGVQASHQEFKPGQVREGWKYSATSYWGEADDPCWSGITTSTPMDSPNAGHGTAVASVIAGDKSGVAKSATIVPVAAMNCGTGGNYTSLIAEGLKYIKEDIEAYNTANPDNLQRSVINLSFEVYVKATGYGGAGGNTDYDEPNNPNSLPILQRAVAALLNLPHTVVVAAAGNKNRSVGPDGSVVQYQDKEGVIRWMGDLGALPAAIPGVIAVGASTRDDKRAWFSNYGSYVSLFAPGAAIESAHIATGKPWRSQADGCFTLDPSMPCTSGTSFAAPHVAGIAARLLEQRPWESGAGIKALLETGASSALDESTLGAGSPDRLLYKSIGRCTRPVHWPE